MPTITEVQKTVDNKHFYKIGDIGQMVICKDESDEGSNADDEEDRGVVNWNAGFTPPLKNVRKKRFRKLEGRKLHENPEIHKQVELLLEMDRKADTVVVDVKEENVDVQSAADSDVGKMSDLTGFADAAAKETASVVSATTGMDLDDDMASQVGGYLAFGWA